MAAISAPRMGDRRPGLPAVAIGIAVIVFTAGTSLLFMLGSYGLMVYVVIGVCSVVAFAAPLRWGIASLIFFAGIAGMLKDIAAYETVAHLGNDIVLFALLIGYVARSAVRLEPLVTPFPYRKPLAILFVSALFLTFLPITHPIVALGGWKGYVIPALLVPVSYVALREPGSSWPIVAALIVTGIANATASLVEQSLGPEVIGNWGPGFIRNIGSQTFAFDTSSHLVWRPFGLAQDAGAAAAIEAISAAVLLYLSFGRRQLLQVLAAAGALFCAYATVNSGVRTAVVMLLVGAMGAFLIRGSRRRSSLALGSLAVLAVGAVLFFLIGQAPVAVQARVGGLLSTTTYVSARGAVYSLLVDAFIKFPLGFGMGKVVPGAELLSGLAGVQTSSAANENLLLAMVYELGWAGAVFAAVLIWQTGKVVLAYLTQRVRDREGGLGAVVLMVLFISGLAGPLLIAEPNNLYVWVFATLAWMRLHPASPGAPSTAS